MGIKETLIDALEAVELMNEARLSGTGLFRLPITAINGEFYTPDSGGFPVYMTVWRYPRRNRFPAFTLFTVEDKNFFKAIEADILNKETFVDDLKKGIEKIAEFTIGKNVPQHKHPYIEVTPLQRLSLSEIEPQVESLDKIFKNNRYIEHRKREVMDFISGIEKLKNSEGFVTAFIGVSTVRRVDTSDTRTSKQYVYLACDRDGFYWRSRLNSENTFDLYQLYFRALPFIDESDDMYVDFSNVSLLNNKAGNFLLAGNLREVVKTALDVARNAPPVKIAMRMEELQKLIFSRKPGTTIKPKT